MTKQEHIEYIAEEQLMITIIQHYTEKGESFRFLLENDIEYTKDDIKEFFAFNQTN